MIKALRKQVEANVLEKVIQRHLFNHLWLLDPSWERATGTEYMERRVASEFTKIDKEFRGRDLGRVDIKYSTAAGTHVIVELKRAKVRTTSWGLLEQVEKYRLALRRLLVNSGEHHPRIEVVCVVGEDLTDWDAPDGREESAKMLAPKNIRVVTYLELIHNAERAYQAFLEENQRAGRLVRLLTAIDAEE